MNKNNKPVILLFNLEVLESAYFPGVSRPSVIGGLNLKEIKDIFTILGKRLKLVGISEFNPTVEGLLSS